MEQHNGIIEIGIIENIGVDAHQIGLLTAQFVHYTDCQQLKVWLPHYGRDGYGSYQIINTATQYKAEEGSVENKVNGSIQLLFDTLPWSDSTYVLEINRTNGAKHLLHFQKYPTDFPPKRTIAVEPETTTNDSMWKVYLDGWGNPILDEDLILRKSMFKNLKARLEYEGNFRGGNVIYIEGQIRLSFWHEMGGGNCKMFIDIPSEKTWEKATNTPLHRRDEIARFVAETVKREQASSWRYEIGEREIAFY